MPNPPVSTALRRQDAALVRETGTLIWSKADTGVLTVEFTGNFAGRPRKGTLTDTGARAQPAGKADSGTYCNACRNRQQP